MSIDLDKYFGRSATQRLIAGEIAWNLEGYINHWSASSFSMLRRCPYQWQQRYIHGRKERPAEAPFVGTAVHKGLEHNFAHKVDSHQDIPTSELLDWFNDLGWAKTLANEQEHRGDEVLWKTSPDEAKTRGAVMLSAYRNAVAPRIQPLSTEGMVSVDLGLAVPVEGRYDLERTESVIDYKTGQRARSKPQESWRIQAAVYGEARNRPVEFHSLTATEKNKVTIITPLEEEALLVRPSILERRRMVQDLRSISAEACFYMAIYGPDEPWPTHGRFHDWACGWCGFRDGCPAWSGSE